MKKLLMIVGAGLGLALLAGGVVFGVAAAQDGGDSLGQQLIARVAAKLGVGEEELRTAIAEAQSEIIDEAVVEGRLTPEQGERLKERIEEGRLLGPLAAYHLRHRLCHGAQRLILRSAANVLDMERSDLLNQLKEGQTLAQVAEAQGFSVDDFKVALLEQVQQDLSTFVAEGKLTQRQADAIFARIEEYIDRIVNAHFGRHCDRQASDSEGAQLPASDF